MTITINHDAPVVAASSIHVDARPEVVWATVSDIDRWPEWNPGVATSTLHGRLEPGATFTWKAGPGTITSTLRQVDAPRVIAWTGKTMGIRAIHVWRITVDGDGVMLHTEESWEGKLPRLFRRVSQKALEKAIHDGLAAVKSEAERLGEAGRGEPQNPAAE